MRITTAFSSTSTAADVIHGIDLAGRRALVTGAASGIGVETARALASAGAPARVIGEVARLRRGDAPGIDVMGEISDAGVRSFLQEKSR